MKNASKIKSKIETLKAQLREAEAAERERKSARVARAAERAGLLDLAIEPATLEREFRALAERLKAAESTDTAKPETQTPTPATEAVVAPETAATVADQATGSDEKSDKKRWGWK